ncbi:MAG: extracellular solute-binding protein [Muribaculum sp.]|nr:extracellular solute-binding protein [Muribaculum sp.]
MDGSILRSTGNFGVKNLRFRLCCLLLCAAVFQTACGAETLEDESGFGASGVPEEKRKQEWVYVPERIELEDERADYDKMQLVGDTVRYISMNGESSAEAHRICGYSLQTRELESAFLEWQMEGSYRDIVTYVFLPDSSVWLIVNVYPADFGRMSRFLCRFDTAGKCMVSWDVSEHLGSGVIIERLAADAKGRLYVFTDEAVCLYGQDGSYRGSISYDADNVQIRGCAEGDGRFYVCVSKGESADSCALEEVDFESCTMTEAAENFPNVNGLCTARSSDADPVEQSGDLKKQYDVLLYDDEYAYGYDFSSSNGGAGGKSEELFAWMDSDINGYYVTGLSLLEDGRYYATVEDWISEDRSIVLLTRTKAEEAPQRVNLTLATVGGGSDLVGMTMRFNRNSNQWHVDVKYYDSMTDLYNAMLAKEPMDLVDLSGVDVENLCRQGFFEDLTPYVEQSAAFGASDFVDGLLNVYSFEGTLAGIPETFRLQTVVGDGRRFGNGRGLTLEQFLAVCDDQRATPFGELTKEDMMRYLLMFNEDAFIDWDKGECHFDSGTFRNVLELVNRFPDEIKEEQEEVSVPSRIQNGEVLFAIADLGTLNSLQPFMGMVGEGAECIGFPTVDGSGGTLLFPGNAFGITAVSEHKDGAWAFVEAVLTRPKNQFHNMNMGYFPAMKADLNAKVGAAIKEDAEWAAKHGDREFLFGRRTWEDGWFFDFHAVTWEEVNEMMALVPEAIPYYQAEEDAVIRIISEEAAAYYKGQKSVEDVAEIIQNRVRLYVMEKL